VSVFCSAEQNGHADAVVAAASMSSAAKMRRVFMIEQSRQDQQDLQDRF
jgi:hypothetical protein